MPFYTHLQLLLQPSVLWLSVITFNDTKPPPKWILRKFDVSWIWPWLGGLPYLETFTWQNLTLAERVTRSAGRATHLGGSPHLSCKRNQIKTRDYMDEPVIPPKRVTSPACGLPPPCKQALRGQTADKQLQSRVLLFPNSLTILNYFSQAKCTKWSSLVRFPIIIVCDDIVCEQQLPPPILCFPYYYLYLLCIS